MVEEPYYNEPSYEAQRYTKEGDEASAAYNEQLQYNTIRWAMLDVLRNPPEGFENAIRGHFMLTRSMIMEECSGWLARATYKERMKKVFFFLSRAFTHH